MAYDKYNKTIPVKPKVVTRKISYVGTFESILQLLGALQHTTAFNSGDEYKLIIVGKGESEVSIDHDRDSDNDDF